MATEEVIEEDAELDVEGIAEVEGVPEIDTGFGVPLGAITDPNVAA